MLPEGVPPLDPEGDEREDRLRPNLDSRLIQNSGLSSCWLTRLPVMDECSPSTTAVTLAE